MTADNYTQLRSLIVPSVYPAKPSYSHCVELGRTDGHFSTAARVKKTVTPPTDKTVTVLALVSFTVEPGPLKHGGQFVRALRCHQGTECGGPF